MKLVSMVDYVLDFEHRLNYEENNKKIIAYAKFLSMPLDLWMFVPCDEDGNVLKEPEKYMEIQTIGSMNSYANERDCVEAEMYHKALNNVIFEGFKVDKIKTNKSSLWITDRKRIMVWCIIKNKFEMFMESKPTIENIISYRLTITQSAINKYQI